MLSLNDFTNNLFAYDKLNMVDEKIKCKEIINMILDKTIENLKKEPDVEEAESTEN